jgi:hypothetical protein
MTKTYITPELVPQGSVAELTKAERFGTKDPIDPEVLQDVAAGSVGFQL